jgi:hypothetical protein
VALIVGVLATAAAETVPVILPSAAIARPVGNSPEVFKYV